MSLKALIESICRETGPRPAGSAAETKAASMIRQRLADYGATTDIEEFPVVPRSLHALLVALAIGHAISCAVVFLFPAIALALAILVIATYVADIVLGWDVFAHVLKTATSQNVVGHIAPSGARKRLLIFSAHHDSAFRMPLLARPTYPVVFLLIAVFGASVFALFGLALYETGIWVFSPGLAGARSMAEVVTFSFCGLGAIAAFVLIVAVVRRDSVPGANDNLSGVAVALGVAQRLGAKRPTSTEVWVVSFGAEETCLWGSRHFVRRHADEIADGTIVNIETIGQQGTLRVISGELMTATMHSSEARDLIARGALAAGRRVRTQFMPFGLTDATSFSRRGLRAATLLRLDAQGYLDHYHTPGDNPDSIREENLQEALEVCLKIVDLVDGIEQPAVGP